MDSRLGYVRTRLSAMMFFQFFVWASWWMPVGGYLNKVLHFEQIQIGRIMATTALGAILAPLFVGYVADRLFATERVLCVLHVIGGLCLWLAAGQTTFVPLMILLVVSTFCFMPTLALANSLTFRNIDDPNKFSRIAVFGTIGWILSGLIVGYMLENSPRWHWIFYLAGGAEILLGAYCLSLPHTPPKGAEAGGDVLGLGAVRLLKEPSFLVFVVCAFLIAIPASFYFFGMNQMLNETERPKPAALMTLGQVTEICVMFTLPWFIAQLGLTRILALGMLIWAVRYLLFATLSFPLILLGILVHGFAYCFVFVGSYIYVDKRAPRDLRASAQSLISVLVLGVGMFLGNNLAGLTADEYPPLVGTMSAVLGAGDEARAVEKASLPKWDDVMAFDANHDGRLSPAELKAIPESGFKVVKEVGGKEEVTTHPKQELIDILMKVDNQKDLHTRGDFRSMVAQEVAVSKVDWREAQTHNWVPIWLWPAAGAALICALFWLRSREEPEQGQAADEQPLAEEPPVRLETAGQPQAEAPPPGQPPAQESPPPQPSADDRPAEG